MNGIFNQKGEFRNNPYFIFFLIFVVTSSLLTWLILFIDDTNYGTGNGLWKSVFINDYIFRRDLVDYQNLEELSYVTNLFYFPVYAWLIQYSPLHFFDLIIVQKMAIINAWFAGLSLGAFYLMMVHFIENNRVAIIATLAHLSGGIFLALSTNSEDIIPAYTFFVFSVLGIVLYLRSGAVKYLIFTSIAFAISWLFHWTMAIGPAPAFVVVILLKQGTLKKTMKHWAIFAGTNIFIVALCAIYFNADFFQLIYAGKVMDSGWITGLSWEKPVLLYTGFINYIIGGFQFLGIEHFLDTLLRGPWYYPSFIAGSVIFLVLAWQILYFFIKKRKDKFTFMFGVFLLVNFLFAQLMNMVEFATDLQFHIQPMIWLPMAFGLLYLFWINLAINNSIVGFLKKISPSIFLFVFVIMPIALLAFNITKFKLPGRQGLDSYYVNQLKLVEAKTNLKNTFFVTRGWDEFRNWGYSYWGRSFRYNTITITDFLRDNPRETVEDARNRLTDTITSRIDKGYTVLTGPEIIDRPEYEIIFIFEGFQQEDKIKGLIKTIKHDFARSTHIKTELGIFYKLQPQ